MDARTLPRNSLSRPRRLRQNPEQARHWRDQTWWTWTKRALSIVFFVAVGALLWRYAQHIDWDEVGASVRNTAPRALVLAALLAALSHLLYSCFDLIGKHYTGHNLPAPMVMAVSFVSYAFNLCIGSLVGGVGFRYRLYSRLGLKNGVITRIVSMSMLTNWLGYKLMAGIVFLVHPLVLPPSWHMGNHGMAWIGALLVSISVAYILACVKLGDRCWTIRGHEIYLPPWRMAIVQMVISCMNWALMAGIIYVLLGGRVHYYDVLTVLLIGAIAGVVAHVPAGLGVFEMVFVALLGHIVPPAQLIGALLGYRAIYYIAPCLVAFVVYLFMEIHANKNRERLKRMGAVEGGPTPCA